MRPEIPDVPSMNAWNIHELPLPEKLDPTIPQARVEVRAIAAKQNKVFSIQPQLELPSVSMFVSQNQDMWPQTAAFLIVFELWNEASLLAGSGDIRHLAQRAFASYLRSVQASWVSQALPYVKYENMAKGTLSLQRIM